MRDFFREKYKAILQDLAVGMFSSLLLLVLGNLIGWLVPKELTGWYESVTGVPFAVSVSVLTLMAIVCFMLAQRYLINYVVCIPKSKIYKKFPSVHASMSILGREQMVMRYRCECVSKITVYQYPLAYHWTGTSSRVESNLPDAKAVKNQIQEDYSDQWLLEFRTPKAAGQTFTIDYSIVAEDCDRVSKPLFGFDVNYPIDELTLELTFNKMDPQLQLANLSSVCKLSNSDIIISSEPLDHELNKYVLKVKNPRYLHKYRFEWEYQQ